ncbi:MAG TPA: PIG-L family deacetylase [Burkholderiaceae bacterium]|nr:PIG-L family deacetylase [Burkholderiaceae bacterium]
MKAIRWLMALCGVLALAGGPLASWAGPALAQCNGIKDLVFVPHQDDDLLFMNPDIESAIDAGGCVQVVYLTASERGEGEPYMLGRERGVRAAYAYMAQTANEWTEDTVGVGARTIARFTLAGNRRVQLLHMRIKDPWLGKGWGSLTPLSQVESVPGTTADSLGAFAQAYTRQDLVQTIADIIRDYAPSTIRHMDDTVAVPYTALCWRCAGHDHPDHIASARLVRDALRTFPEGLFAEVAYVDYPSQERDANLSSAEIADKTEAFRRYAWDDYRYCSGADHCKEPAGPAASWVGRSYYVSRRSAPPILLPASGGGYLLLAVGESNRAANVWTSTLRRWNSVGGRSADPIAAFQYPDGGAGILARDANGRVWTQRQDAQGRWEGWQAIAGARMKRLPAVAAGEAAAVGLGNDGVFHFSAYSSKGRNWPAWSAMPALPGPRPAAALAVDANGAHVVFACDQDGAVWASTQIAHAPAAASVLDSSMWTAWQRLPLPPANGGLAALRNADGLIELFLRDRTTGHLLASMQQRPGGAQGPWRAAVDMGFSYSGQPVAALNEHGKVVAAALDGSSLWLVEEGKAVRIGTGMASVPALYAEAGVLHIAARAAQDGQAYWLRLRRGGAWSAAVLIDPPPAGGGNSFTAAPLRADAPAAPLRADAPTAPTLAARLP